MDDRGWYFGWILLLFLVQNGVNFVQSRPVLSKDDASFVDTGLLIKDFKFTQVLPLGILVTIATLISLLIVLVLCACAEKPERSSQADVGAENEGVEDEDADNGLPESPFPDNVTVPVSDITLTIPLNDAPKQRTSSVQSSSSNSGLPDDALIRCSTIDRRLPELPPTPMPPVTPTNEDEEDDYNRTYDVIGETKTIKVYPTKEDDTNAKENNAEIEDEQYASVSDNAADKPRMPKPDLAEDVDYNSIGQNGQDVNTGEGDEPYASVVVGDSKEPENASYASVANKDDREGYARLRSIQKQKTKEESGDRNGYARLRDVGGAAGRAAGGAKDDDEVPPVPYKPPDLQNEDEEEQDSSTVQRTSGTDAAVAGAAATASVMANDENAAAPTKTKKREPPYTQVSARESLEVVRARQQAEQSARIAAHYQTIEEDQNLDADHDGIYEPVDDQQLDVQPVMLPPPLPGERQGPSNEPSASNNWQITRAPRVYEEITEETRPKPPNTTPAAAAATSQTDNDDDIQPYAVTEKRPIPTDSPTYTVVDRKSKTNYAKVNKTNKGPDQTNNNAMTEARSPDRASPPINENGLPLYAVVEKKGKSQRSKATLKDDVQVTSDTTTPKPVEENYQAVEDSYQSVDDNYQSVDDNYQSVGDMPRSGNPSAAAIAGGMIHVSEHPQRSDLWTKKEHMYIDVETNQPSSPTETNHSASESPRGHSYESIEVVPTATNKKEKQKQAKKAKKEAKRDRKHSKSSKGAKEKAEMLKGSGNGETVWQRQDSAEGNGNSNNNTDPFDDYENISFPLQETRL